jgi:beta-lysine 5,6-aminomutase beta subunit
MNRKEQPPMPPQVRLYGDRMDDGLIQLSFTIPMPACDEARVAAQMFCEKMGLSKISVVSMEPIDRQFTAFVVYAVLDVTISTAGIVVPKLDYPLFGFDEINDMLKRHIDRKTVVIGACIGSDAHTVGIDAIFNMKGYMGDYGLESYPLFQAINMRAQVDTKDLVKKVIETKADAVLISRVVTQRDEHITELKKFLVDLSQAEGVPPHLIKICGGPRITHQVAKDIGYDAGFGPGTKPSQVASYIADEIIHRIGHRDRSPRS